MDCWDSNSRSLGSDAAALPTAPQPEPLLSLFLFPICKAFIASSHTFTFFLSIRLRLQRQDLLDSCKKKRRRRTEASTTFIGKSGKRFRCKKAENSSQQISFLFGLPKKVQVLVLYPTKKNNLFPGVFCNAEYNSLF